MFPEEPGKDAEQIGQFQLHNLPLPAIPIPPSRLCGIPALCTLPSSEWPPHTLDMLFYPFSSVMKRNCYFNLLLIFKLFTYVNDFLPSWAVVGLRDWLWISLLFILSDTQA